MYVLFIGGIMLGVLIPLLKGTRRRFGDSQNQTSWDKTARIEQDLQEAKDEVLFWGFYRG